MGKNDGWKFLCDMSGRGKTIDVILGKIMFKI
jgi:hypothetical protein